MRCCPLPEARFSPFLGASSVPLTDPSDLTDEVARDPVAGRLGASDEVGKDRPVECRKKASAVVLGGLVSLP